ncbi:hypothetical protein SEUCBS140593_009176 [Sporothrix eucalyptigena]|uniref:BTB domain-containing protein n=1 Tax=Sporothrix eucalyptigena TaxID=1812306 RepID=A0ABP0CSP8_9PEZI
MQSDRQGVSTTYSGSTPISDTTTTPSLTRRVKKFCQEFFVHADIFCEHSDYFKSCLRGNFAEAQTQRVEIEDISIEDFALWVNTVYRYHFIPHEGFVLEPDLIQILTVWRLSDRFIHKPLIDQYKMRLEDLLSIFTVEWWRKYYIDHAASDSQRYINELQMGYRYCRAHTLPDAFSDGFVTACANCPAQLYATYASLLDAEFMRLVSVRIVMRHANKNLIPLQEL